ncbi:MAG: UDP-glucose/GDP-mannose dehydrogenase family protein [Phycisphaerae bacterium]|nr:UDP-glucose/GDP-mannose dehydrogenase family protein [Phycisphaerae bacterium]
MRITVVGTGYVGLVSATCLADTGNHVVGLDIDPAKVEQLSKGVSTIYEPGLHDLLTDNLRAGRLRFTTNADEAIAHGQVVFVAVGTPPRQDGSADTSALDRTCRTIAEKMSEPKVVVVKSTVPVGTCDRLEAEMRAQTPHRLDVVSNPEFLKEGTAVDDFLRPDRIVVGAENGEATATIRELYLPFVRNQRPILTMSRAAAEMTKYAANCYLAARISYINEIANICECCGVDVDQVRAGIGTDSRIGFHFLYPGAGYGGSCFPKDVQALNHLAGSKGYSADLLRAVHEINQRQRQLLFSKIANRFAGSLGERTFALWGVTFKPKTDDLREAPAIYVIDRLLEAGSTVRVHDPRGLENLKGLYGDRVICFDDAYDALAGADALVLATEWNEFRTPDFDRMRELLEAPIIFDGRNVYEAETMKRRAFEYHSIGRPTVNGPASAAS